MTEKACTFHIATNIVTYGIITSLIRNVKLDTYKMEIILESQIKIFYTVFSHTRIHSWLQRKQITMILISDGNSEMGAYVRSNLYYSICLRHFIRSRSVTNRLFLNACATGTELPSNISNIEIMLFFVFH